MKRVTINAYQAGLVFKNGVYERMLKEGKHWLGWGETVNIYDKTTAFTSPYELNILLKDEVLKEALHVVEVSEGQLVLMYENGLFKQVLTTGRYAFWKSLMDYRFDYVDTTKTAITENIDRTILNHRLLAQYIRTVTVGNHEKGLLFVDGKYVNMLDSGMYYWWINKIPLQVFMADTRQLQAELNGQEILTKDKAALRINAWAQYHLSDIEKAVLEIKEYDKQLHVRLQLALREQVGTLTLDELMEKKESLNQVILRHTRTADLGIMVTSFGIRDIILPGDMKEIMNQVLVAEKKAQANIIMRREETASTRSLLNTAKLMEDNPMLFKLKEMEYVEKIAEKIGSLSVNGDGGVIDGLRKILVGK